MSENQIKKVQIMGILNLTPDSFSDGGSYHSGKEAYDKCLKMIEEGADIIDVGAESTRPGCEKVSVEEEIRRIAEAFPNGFNLPVPVSIDTFKTETALWCLERGADIINDISGLLDPKMAEAVAKYNAGIVIMHSEYRRRDMDVIEDISQLLMERVDLALSCGIDKSKIILDPGIGFSKTQEDNILIVKRLSEFKKLGYPVLLGASRKSFIGNVLGTPPSDRLEGTVAVSVLGAAAGADILRVHDVKENVKAVRMTEAVIYGAY